MTIRKGESWGSEVARPSSLRVAHSDAELARWITADPDGAYGVADGDLHRTVGAPGSSGATMHRLPIDVLEVEIDGRHHVAVAHVVVRRRWWRGRVLFVCNVGHVGTWNVAPRAHPNDGRFDVVEIGSSMRMRDRWEARRRLPTGTHVPHPAVTMRATNEWTWSDQNGARVWVDGEDTGSATAVTVRLRPDAAAILI